MTAQIVLAEVVLKVQARELHRNDQNARLRITTDDLACGAQGDETGTASLKTDLNSPDGQRQAEAFDDLLVGPGSNESGAGDEEQVGQRVPRDAGCFESLPRGPLAEQRRVLLEDRQALGRRRHAVAEEPRLGVGREVGQHAVASGHP